MRRRLLIIFFVCAITKTIASSDDRFIKKYAMMKIYESCFGPEVVKQIRQEMKEAYAKCSAPSPPPSFEVPMNPHLPPNVLLGKLPPGFAIDPNTQTITKPTDGASHLGSQENELPSNQMDHNNLKAGGPNYFGFRPQQPPFQQQPVPPYPLPSPQFRPMSSSASPFYQFPYMQGPFYPQGVPYNPYSQYQQYQQGGYYPSPYFAGSHRMSRDMDLRERLDLISRGPSPPKIRNITCVMQELGYIDHNLEPNYEKITERISNLPVSTELKGDIQDGLQFCQKFSQCVPDIKRNVAPLSQELVKPMFFFRCYKHKKLEACIMKDIRERFTSEEELEAETDFRSLGRSGRAIRDFQMSDPRFEALDEMAVYLYDYLSGGNGFDFDMYM